MPAPNLWITHLLENTGPLKNDDEGVGDSFTGMLPSHVVEANQRGSESKLAIVDRQPMCCHRKESHELLIGPDIGC